MNATVAQRVSRHNTFKRFLCRVLAFAGLLPLLTSGQEIPFTYVYDFELLSPGSIVGQDGWYRDMDYGWNKYVQVFDDGLGPGNGKYAGPCCARNGVAWRPNSFTIPAAARLLSFELDVKNLDGGSHVIYENGWWEEPYRLDVRFGDLHIYFVGGAQNQFILATKLGHYYASSPLHSYGECWHLKATLDMDSGRATLYAQNLTQGGSLEPVPGLIDVYAGEYIPTDFNQLYLWLGSGLASPFVDNLIVRAYPAAPTVSWAPPASITYGLPLSEAELNATADVPGTFTYTPPLGTVLHAGDAQTLRVTFTPADPAYSPADRTVTIDVLPTLLTITAESQFKLAGEPLPPWTAIYEGFVNEDTEADLITEPTFGTIATQMSPPGIYQVTVSGATSSDYAISYVAGTLTVVDDPDHFIWDDFNDEIMSADLWIPNTYNGGNLWEANGLLTEEANRVSESNFGEVQSRFWLNGDFIVQTDFILESVNGTWTDIGMWLITDPSWNNVMEIMVTVPSDGHRHIESLPIVNGARRDPSSCYPQWGDGSLWWLSQGKFQIVRQGSVLTTLFDIGYGWQGLRSETVTSEPMQLILRVRSASWGPYVKASWDNFSAVALSLTPARQDQTISFDEIKAKAYGDAPFLLQATSTSGLPVTFTSLTPQVVQVADNEVTIVGAGEATIVASQAGDAFYNPAPDEFRSFSVAKAVLTVSADNKAKVYGAPNPEFTYRCFGFVYQDDEAVLSGSPLLTTAADMNSPVQLYDIVVEQEDLTAANYNFLLQNGSLDVTRAGTTVSIAIDPKARKNKPFPITATVLAKDPSQAIVNDGYVEFSVGPFDDPLVTLVTLVAQVENGSASSSLTLPKGKYSITASYKALENGNFNNSEQDASDTLTLK